MRPTFRELQLVMRENRTAQNVAGSQQAEKMTAQSLHGVVCARTTAARIVAQARLIKDQAGTAQREADGGQYSERTRQLANVRRLEGGLPPRPKRGLPQ